MKKKLLFILALLCMAVTGAWAQTETLLVTINSQGNDSFTSGSQTFNNIATVTFSGTVYNDNDEDGWYWYDPRSGTSVTMSVTPVEGYTITKVNFYCDEGSAFDETDPFEARLDGSSLETYVNGTEIGCIGVNKIEVYGYATPVLTANSDGAATPNYWATYYNGTTSYTADANTTVYKAAMNGTSSLTLTEVANREIPSDKAVILKSTSATITLTPAASTTADLSDNVLMGGTTVTSGYDAYTLSRGSAGTGTVGFYKFNGASLDGSKAHLEILQGSLARGFIGFGDDNTTAIEAPTATIIVEDGEIYDLTGRRIEGQPTRKGIYVKNGQKFIVK